MSTAAVHGIGGSVKIGAVASGDIDNWKLTLAVDVVEATNFSSAGWKEYISGAKSWNATFGGSFNMADTNQIAFQGGLLAGTTVAVKFYVDATHSYSGTAFIKQAAVDTAVGGIVKVSFTAEGTGALTYA